MLGPLCTQIDIWHTIYNHVMATPQAIVEWFKGSALQPYLLPLDAAGAREISCRLCEEDRRRLQAASDGKVMFEFPRLFIVAMR